MVSNKQALQNIDTAIKILRLAKKKRSMIFIKGVTSYIIKMAPADIKKELQDGGSVDR
jgi:hypothetical protein